MDIEVSEEFREQSYSGESLYDARLTINGNEVPTSQIKKITINSPIVDKSQEGFYIGTFISQEITIIFKNLDGLDIQTGNEVYLEIGQLIDGEYEYVPIGHYLIDDLSENYSSTCQIPCLDYATKFKPNVDYSPCFEDGSATVDTILEWICDYFNVEIGDYPTVNGNVEVSTYDSTVSGKQWISYIAELKGCNAKIGRDGKLYLIPIKRQPTTTIDALKSKSWSLGEKYEISKVVYFDAIRNFTFGNDNENTLYIRQDNPFVTGTYAEQIVENIYDEVNGFQVYSLKVENYGDISLNCWDIVTYTLGEDENQNTISYNTFYDNNMIYEMNIMVTNETKIATKQQEVTTNVLGGDEKAKIRKLSTTVNGLEGTITLLAEEVGEYDDRITTVEQDVNTIRQTAISYEDLKRNVKSVNMLYLENAVPNYPLKFSIKNASVLFPKTNLYPSSNTIPEYRHLVLVVDKTRNLSDEAKIIELPVKNLYAQNNVYDEFVVEKNRAKLIHRLIANQQGEIVPLQQEFVEDLGEVNIELFEGDNYIYLYSLINDGAIYEIDYTIPSEFTDTFATEVYVNSSIEQTANQILLQVNEKVDEDEIIAKLNVAVEEGKGVVNLVGNTVTIESDNFTLDADGRIDATSGEVGGFNLSETTLDSPIYPIRKIYRDGEYVEEEFEIYPTEFTDAIREILLSGRTPTQEEIELYDLTGDGRITSQDYALARATQVFNIDKDHPGRLSLNTKSVNNVLTIYDKDDNERVNLSMTSLNFAANLTEDETTVGSTGINTYNDDYGSGLSPNGLMTHNNDASTFIDAIINDLETPLLVVHANNTETYIDNTQVRSQNFVNNSLEEDKKNFEKFENALDIIKKADVYSYNWKSDDENAKKQYGLVIGKKYNTPKEFLSQDNKGINTYSMISICLQAIKEQQEEIDELKKLIKESDK